ncbi:MAG: leucine-rich repeat protein [Hungateiclostridium thermocellum]|nr:leucine-rich repeat protein [Acetivibrio thermocellus]
MVLDLLVWLWDIFGIWQFIGQKRALTRESYTIHASVALVRSCAFANCTALESITIPPSVNSISDRVFDNCTNLTTIINLYEGKQTINDEILDTNTPDPKESIDLKNVRLDFTGLMDYLK